MGVRVVLIRVAGAALALLVAAWLALGLRSAVLTERGVDQVSKGFAGVQPGSPAAARVSGAEDDLRRAAVLNPDRLPEAYRAQVLGLLGQPQRGRKLVEQVVRDEPENLEAWQTAYAIYLKLGDRRLQAVAIRHIKQLNPAPG